PIGIDLGTTNSAAARVDGSGRTAMIPNTEGDLLTPSVVLFDGDDVVVGQEALNAIATDTDKVAACAKREIGHRTYHKTLDQRQFAPEVIEACILAKIKHDTTLKIGPFTKAVITVPAYFDEVRRKSTQDAGLMAGIEVLDIINEPTAAAVAYGLKHGLLDARGETAKKLRFLVYDLGGGTFDVTVMEIAGRDFQTLATDGDVQLGGYDWDQRLVDLVAEKFNARHGSDPRENPQSSARLWQACEEAKRLLSTRPQTTVTCSHDGSVAQVEVTREQFEEATRDLLDRTRFTVTQTLQVADLDWHQIDSVLLVGGSTRMPMVPKMLRELSALEPEQSHDADEIVAHGAALRAALLLADKTTPFRPFKIRNVNSHSLGVVGVDRLTGRLRNGAIIPRNTPLPVTARRTFETQTDNQKSILVQIVEGESRMADDCTPIGKCTVSNLPPNLPAKSPIDVLFHYRDDGRLTVRVTLPGTDTNLETDFTRELGLSREHLEGWRRYIGGLEF
ncbi:MAG: Hsp70 family protein, partial [Chloroflexota bacterium]|nr:Hsp70 family protein [Chloroflexota bacterium]